MVCYRLEVHIIVELEYIACLKAQKADLATLRAKLMEHINDPGAEARDGAYWEGMVGALVKLCDKEQTIAMSLNNQGSHY